MKDPALATTSELPQVILGLKTEEQMQLLEWKLKKIEQISESFRSDKWLTWNGETKAEMIFEAVKAIREELNLGKCKAMTSEQIFNEIKSSQGKTLNEALAWHRFGSLVSDENREQPNAVKEFKILNAVFK